MRAKIDQVGTEIDADFDLAFVAGAVCLTVHARGGSTTSAGRTNPQYEDLIQTLLERLKVGNAVLEDVLLKSRTVAHLSPAERRIPLRDYSLPLALAAVADITELRLAIRRSVLTSHSRSKVATHGNATKRIELVASCPVPVFEMAALLEWGVGGTPVLDPGSEEASNAYIEGGVTLVTHLRRERNRQLVLAAKSAFSNTHGRVSCEVCGFDYEKAYGDLGANFIEAHHESPLAERDSASETRLEDLRMVCANCHRMLHRRLVSEAVGVSALKLLLCARTTK